MKEEMGEQARCALREAAMVVAAARKAGSSKILFTIHAGVVRRALCRSVGRSVLHHDHARCERTSGRDARYQRRGKSPSSLPSLSHAPLRPKRAVAANAKLPPLLHSDLRGVPE